MPGWSLTLLVITLYAGAFGFGGVAGASAGFAQFLFVIFLLMSVATPVVRIFRT